MSAPRVIRKSRRARRPGRRYAFILGLFGLLLVAASCVGAAVKPSPAVPSSAPTFNGAVLEPPLELPELTLSPAAGGRFSTADTRDRVSLFFFGYTTCPDVCPVTMVYVSQVRRLLGDQASGIDSYFVTVDPERDTPQKLVEYAAKFDPAITPLTGNEQELARARAAFGIVAQKRPVPDSAAGYFVDHSAGLYAIDRDNRIRLVFPYGMSPTDIAADVKRLLEEPRAAAQPPLAQPPLDKPPLDKPAPSEQPVAGSTGARAARPSAAPGIENAWARAGSSSGTSAVYLTLRNGGPAEERLLGARTDAASAVELHQSSMEGGVMRMRPSGPIAIPANSEVTLAPAGLHIMLLGLRKDLTDGDQLELTLQLERAGELRLNVPIRASAPMSGGHG
jgi:protein SCO1/2